MKLKIGDIVTGKISGIRTYGAFVNIDGVAEQGLIHISECKNGYVTNLEQIFQLGQTVKVVILDIDEYTGKISLSTRALQKTSYNLEHYHKKRYWTNYKNKIGFQIIAAIKPIWVQEVLKNIN